MGVSLREGGEQGTWGEWGEQGALSAGRGEAKNKGAAGERGHIATGTSREGGNRQ